MVEKTWIIKKTHSISMNYSAITNMYDFEKIIESPIFIACDKELLDREISTNMWIISFDDRIIKEMSIDKLLKFTNNLLNKKKQQLSELNLSCDVIFYMWFDEMASQLRFNLISGLNKTLPFGCQLNIVDSPNTILAQFLQSQHNPEIGWDELEEITNEADESSNTEKPFILDVFVRKLNNNEK